MFELAIYVWIGYIFFTIPILGLGALTFFILVKVIEYFYNREREESTPSCPSFSLITFLNLVENYIDIEIDSQFKEYKPDLTFTKSVYVDYPTDLVKVKLILSLSPHPRVKGVKRGISLVKVEREVVSIPPVGITFTASPITLRKRFNGDYYELYYTLMAPFVGSLVGRFHKELDTLFYEEAL